MELLRWRAGIPLGIDRPKSSASVETEGFSAGDPEESGWTGEVDSTGDPMGQEKGKIKEATTQGKTQGVSVCADLGAYHFRNCFVIIQLKSEVLRSLSEG